MIKLITIGIIFLSLFINFNSFSQDTIFVKTGDNINSMILEVNDNFVQYRKVGYRQDSISSIVKGAVKKIQFQSGTEYLITDSLLLSNEEISDMRQMYFTGQKDAQKYYTKCKKAGTWTFLSTLVLTEVTGAITAAACASTPPKRINLQYPDERLMENKEYASGYLESAHKKKTKRVWSNFLAVAGIHLISYVAYLSLRR